MTEHAPATARAKVRAYRDTVDVEGGNRLAGAVTVAGSKIASVSIVAAALLSDEWVELKNLPDVEDIRVLLGVTELLGGEVKREGEVVAIRARDLRPDLTPAESVLKSVHGTIYLLPVYLARFGRVSLTTEFGGCRIGVRPIDHVLQVMVKLGATVERRGNRVIARASRLAGARLSADYASDSDKYRSGATKTALLLGACAHGDTVIESAYTRASILELAAFLRVLGVSISGEGTNVVIVRGGSVRGGRYEVAGDYLEALTYLALVAACGGRIEVYGFRPEHCRSELELLMRAGLVIDEIDGGVRAHVDGRLRAASFTTQSVDTDIQPLLAAALAKAEGITVIEETVWERRFGYAPGLRRMGADIRQGRGCHAIELHGVPELHGASVRANDLRAAAALIVAAASARGHSQVSGTRHILRGYADFWHKLRTLGVSAHTR